jgi:3',5'-cyclic AMP phosphodiesterase CpdA
MKNLSLITAALLVLSACTQVKPFTFVQMSDTQIGFMDRSERYARSDTLMRKAVEAVNALEPALVVLTGDMIDDPYSTVQDSIYRVRIAELQAPLYLLPGNHDIKPFNEENHAHYLDWRGYDRFSFRENGCAFIGFDSNCIQDGAEEFEAAQFAWLREELKNARNARYTFVFLHCPVVREAADEREDHFNFPIPKRRQYLELFKEYGVDAVFAGHCHQDYAGECEGIRLYTAGPVGSALGRARSGYHVIRVDRDDFTVTYVPTRI